jgi:hypothetical protein
MPRTTGRLYTVVFERSPGTGYYVIPLVSLDAGTSAFIYNGPFNENTPADVTAFFEDLRPS